MADFPRTPLDDIHRAQGAAVAPYHGALVPLRFSDPGAEHQSVRKSAGILDFSFRALFAATGADHVTFLHNMLSNDIKTLAPGQGTYATLLDVKGHILSDLRVYRDRDQILLETDVDLRAKTIGTLERYIIMDDVTLQPLDLASVAFQGPQARPLLEKTIGAALPRLDKEYEHAIVLSNDEAVRVVRASSTGEEGYEVWAGASELGRIWDAARREGAAYQALPCGTQALESLRIEAGIPRYGTELGEDTLPLEAGLLNALSFTKGCYIGQEIVERARSRGHVNWKLAGFFVEADTPPAAGEQLFLQGKQAGEITSSCVSPTLGRILALGYVRREASEPGTRLMTKCETVAEVAELPFYRSQFRTDAEKV